MDEGHDDHELLNLPGSEFGAVAGDLEEAMALGVDGAEHKVAVDGALDAHVLGFGDGNGVLVEIEGPRGERIGEAANQLLIETQAVDRFVWMDRAADIPAACPDGEGELAGEGGSHDSFANAGERPVGATRGEQEGGQAT